jgi:MinD superfamily P-loop ATPase
MEIAIISGKGGTGKSSISAAFATLSERVVLADCDVDAANMFVLFHPEKEEEQVYVSGQKAILDEALCSQCGLCVDACRFDAIDWQQGRVKINELLCDGCWLCAHICPEAAIAMENSDQSRLYAGAFRNGEMVYGRLAPGEENSGRLVSLVREKAKKLSNEKQLETIILDGPPGIGCPVISTITGTDHVVIVTEPSLSGFNDLKRTYELCMQFRVKVWVIINKYDLNEEVTQFIEDYCNRMNITLAGKLPFDRSVVDAMVQCMSIVEYQPQSIISITIQEIFNSILNFNTINTVQ